MIKNKKLLSVTCLLSSTLVLAQGCSTGETSFSSEPGKGFGWKSMRQNHQRIIEGMANTAASTDIKPPVVLDTASVIMAPPWIDIKRTPDQYLRIWIPPHQDAHGNLHEEQAIHIVMNLGQWILPGRGSNA